MVSWDLEFAFRAIACFGTSDFDRLLLSGVPLSGYLCSLHVPRNLCHAIILIHHLRARPRIRRFYTLCQHSIHASIEHISRTRVENRMLEYQLWKGSFY